MRRHTSIPVPRVLSWSSDSSNPVGAEYIIMEKAAGVPLFQQWAKMTEFEKLQLIKNLTKLEAQLSAIRFPAYGGLYPRTLMNRLTRSLDIDIDPSETFCIGPSCDRSFDSEGLEFDQGPCTLPVQHEFSFAKNSHRGFDLKLWISNRKPRIASDIKQVPTKSITFSQRKS